MRFITAPSPQNSNLWEIKCSIALDAFVKHGSMEMLVNGSWSQKFRKNTLDTYKEKEKARQHTFPNEELL